MIFSVRKKTKIATAAIVALGFSSVVLTFSPSMAADGSCSQDGTLVGDVCVVTETSGTGTFTPDSTMTGLQALLVGGGGNSLYGYAGGGGKVTVVDLDDASDPIDYTVGAAGASSSIDDGVSSYDAAPGSAGEDAGGGTSGSGYAGSFSYIGSYGAGGGAAGGAAEESANGGPGVSPGDQVNSDSPFYGVTDSYGGGGAAANTSTAGSATDGGGYIELDGSQQTAVAPRANSGGGAGGGTNIESNVGSRGVVVFRWKIATAATYTVSFETGDGTAVDPLSIADGDSATRPGDPALAGYVFAGWYTNINFETEFDFAAGITADTTVFAKWDVLTPTTVTASFNLGGHGSVDAQTFTSGGTVTKPTDPTAAGFVFSGWFIDADFSTEADFSAAVSSDTTLFAKWETELGTTDGETTTTAAGELPRTGAEISPVAVPLGVLVLALGGGLVFWSTRRAALRRKQSIQS